VALFDPAFAWFTRGERPSNLPGLMLKWTNIFEMFRGEDPCWKKDGIPTFACYCPWCGKKLPDKLFIEEE
jgi:hypothetical protein